MMNAWNMQTVIEDALRDLEASDFRSIRTYEEAGVLTKDHGLIVTTVDGSEFQITIVKRK